MLLFNGGVIKRINYAYNYVFRCTFMLNYNKGNM